MAKYLAFYEDRSGEIISTAYFNGSNITDAKAHAQAHKRHTPEIIRAKGVKTTVRRVKAKDGLKKMFDEGVFFKCPII